MAWTPASVRPAPVSLTGCPCIVARAFSSSSCTERAFFWRCQPPKSGAVVGDHELDGPFGHSGRSAASITTMATAFSPSCVSEQCTMPPPASSKRALAVPSRIRKGRAVRVVPHEDIAELDARESRAERLAEGFLGGETRRERKGAARSARPRVGDLLRVEKALDQARHAEPVLDAADMDDVDADAGNQGFASAGPPWTLVGEDGCWPAPCGEPDWGPFF